MRNLARFATFVGTLALAAPAFAGTLISQDFTRVSAAESLTAPFTSPTGTLTKQTYTGPVEVLISGTGYSSGPAINDAFYFVPSAEATGGYYRLGIGTDTDLFAPYRSELTATRLITFIDGIGSVSGATPAYAADNAYHFVIDAGSTATHLGFGVLDGIYGDNGGAYNISLYQLRAGAVNGAVPEPATWAMFLMGLMLTGAVMRRRSTNVTVKFA